MKLTLTIPDEQFEQLEAVAKQQGKLPAKFVSEALNYTMQFNPLENQILLRGPDVSAIGMVTGGHTFRSATDIVRFVQDLAKVKVNGIEFNLEAEDLHALKQQYESFKNFMTFDEYVHQNVNEALSQYLWGSTRGTLAWR